ncbi:hypothetical protein [Flagellimonas eckloniae]|uniref:hypothetical protein n=1 Tax=Flagellimonas eckloniae TaxID=346185 RepID=UPI0006DCEE0B|nr:hypothetical protein [Allomuricauda eckloniae]
MPFDSKTASEAGAKSSRKGSPNKTTASIRSRIQKLVDAEYEAVLSDLKELSPKDRVNAFISMLEFVLPKLNRSEIEDVSFDVQDFLSLSKEERLQRIAALEKKQMNKELKKYCNG